MESRISGNSSGRLFLTPRRLPRLAQVMSHPEF